MGKQLEMLKKALEMGAEIRIEFYSAKSEDEAKEQIKPFVDLMDQPCNKTEGNAVSWFRVVEGNVEVTAIYHKLEEAE